MSFDSETRASACRLVSRDMGVVYCPRSSSPSHQPGASAPRAPPVPLTRTLLAIGLTQAKERTHHLDNPETPQQTTPENAATTNGPSGNGGGTATATVPRREPPPPQPSRKYYTITELINAKPKDLIDIGKEFNVEGAATLPKQDLITRVLQAQTEAQGNIFAQGILEIVEDGFGFLRRRSLLPSPEDVYVGSSQVRRLGLRTGDFVTGQTRPPKDSEKDFSLLRVEAVNGIEPELAKRRPVFEDLTPIFPEEMFHLETDNANLSQRLIDLVNPLGKGQRALIVSPPKAGKTQLLKDIANGISGNHSDVHIMVVLVGERPEEVTDIRRSIKGEVFSSTFDEPTENHTRVAELALERAKRLVLLLGKMLSAVGQIEGTELLLQRLAKTKTNKDFLGAIAKSMEADKS